MIQAGITACIEAEPPLLIDFRHWMRQLRGVGEATLYNYSIHIGRLLACVGEEPKKYCARDLRQFVMEASRQCGWASAKKCTTALRMFLRFLIAEGKCPVGLDAAIPVLAHWRLASLPRYLLEEDIEKLITSCSTTSAVGPDGHLKIPHLWPGQNPPPWATIGQ